MKFDHIFLVFMIVCGAIAGGFVVGVPQSTKLMVPPYFWILIAMLAFEGLAHWRFGGSPGSLISVEFRLIGLLVGVALLFAIPYLAGVPVSLL